MNKNLATEIINCLPRERSLYPYYKDYYALQLLKEVSGNGIKVSDLKNSRYATLLNKKVVKQLLANCGNNRIRASQIEPAWQDSMEYFTLTLDSWDGNEGDWSQTSRRGWNLVLQLNFSNQHNSYYRKLVKPTDRQALNFFCHPVFKRDQDQYFRETLAWSRLDIDFDNNECLIEEVQSDWIRDVKSLLSDARNAKKRQQKGLNHWPVAGQVDDVIRYCEYFNARYANIWAEAMLSAVLFFVRSELGINQLYYHSCQSGAQVKNINGSKPPRSLYSDLPKAFCFRQTNQGPGMLQDDIRYRRLRRKVKKINWYELGGLHS
ncbi:MAG: hypothetical protein OEY09_11220 [Gammaproteobacteria bacterium]|nr:hypothetical protein [Gammaproteobacteria bacterium]